MIITPDIFQGEITLGHAERLSAKETINWFINKYEPIFIADVLGCLLAAEFNDGLSANPVEEKWTVLANMLKPSIANFVYTKYMRNKITETSASGETLHLAITAERRSPWNKIVLAWNEMVDQLYTTNKIITSSGIYAKYNPKKTYEKINPIGI